MRIERLGKMKIRRGRVEEEEESRGKGRKLIEIRLRRGKEGRR